MPVSGGEAGLTVPELQDWISVQGMDWVCAEVLDEIKTSQFTTSQYDVYELDFGPLTNACKSAELVVVI